MSKSKVSPAAEAAPQAPSTEVAAADTTVQAAGVFDDVALLLPFLFDPSKIMPVVDGVRWMIEEKTWEGQWNGFKKIGDVAFPLLDRFAAQRKVSAAALDQLADEEQRTEVRTAIEVSQLQTYVEVQSYVEAQARFNGELLGRLKDAFGKLQGSPLGQMMIQLLLAKLTGGLLAPQ